MDIQIYIYIHIYKYVYTYINIYEYIYNIQSNPELLKERLRSKGTTPAPHASRISPASNSKFSIILINMHIYIYI